MRSAWLLSCATLLAACGGDGPAVSQGVLHLDPRLADGRSSAAALAGESHAVQEWLPNHPDDAAGALAPWVVRNGLFRKAKKGAGVLVRAAEYDPARGIDKAFFVHEAPLDAQGIDALEIDVAYYGAGGVALIWRVEDGLGGAGQPLRVDSVTRTQEGLQTVRVQLADHPGWRGTIESIALYPAVKGGQTYELSALRFMRGGFEPGPAANPASGDAGLLGLSGDLRRTWVSDLDVPLFASARVPLDGQLAVDVAAPGRAHGSHDTLQFAVDARVDGKWQERGRRSLAPARGASARAWRTLHADLHDLAGRDVELRLRVTIDGDGTGGELERARAWWGAPLVTGELARDRRPNVVLVTLDTLRADALGCYGGPPYTPHLDVLAGGGLLFEQAWSACNSTLPSHASILTGLAVPDHGALDNRSVLSGDVPLLAEAFQAAGYETAAAVSVHHLQSGYSGFGRGFDRYLDVQPDATLDGAGTIEAVRRWAEGWGASGERPLFLWVHLFDPHTPYGPPDGFLAEYTAQRLERDGPPPARVAEPGTIGRTRYTDAGQFLEGISNRDYARFLYDAGVAYTDALFGDLRALWREAGLEADTAWIVTSDHGESLGEHDIWYGHEMLHAQTLHVPLILCFPDGPRGERSGARVSTVDIAPTLTDYLGLAGPASSGLSLFDAARGAAPPDRRVYFSHGSLVQVGCRDAEAHYFQNEGEYVQLGRERSTPDGAGWLYAPADLECIERLDGERPELLARYRGELDAWLIRVRKGRHQRAQVSSEDEERLQGMGYGGGEGEDGAPQR